METLLLFTSHTDSILPGGASYSSLLQADKALLPHNAGQRTEEQSKGRRTLSKHEYGRDGSNRECKQDSSQYNTDYRREYLYRWRDDPADDLSWRAWLEPGSCGRDYIRIEETTHRQQNKEASKIYKYTAVQNAG